MTKRKKRLNIPRLLITAVMLFAILIGPWRALAYAEVTDNPELRLDKTDVITDLTDGSINDEKFDITQYAFDSGGKTTVFSFLEYCYAFREADQDNYALYVYVHNPKGIEYVGDSVMNNITIGVYDENGQEKLPYSVYRLKFLNNSDTTYKGLFYKFRVDLSADQKRALLEALNSVKRVYSVSEINLLVSGETNADSIAVEKKFYYEGYAAGYGFDAKDEKSTLTCYTDYLETISLECHSTTYRPEGTNGKNDYTQDSLHSVYFTLPKRFVTKYGKMVGAHGRYLRATLNPFLVTGNQDAYNAISSYLGKSAPGNFNELAYTYCGAYEVIDDAGFFIYYHDYSYNIPTSKINGVFTKLSNTSKYPGQAIDKLYMVFNAGEGTDSADNYTVKSEDIYAALKDSPDKFGGDIVRDKYAKCMFSSVDSAFTEFNITTGDERYEDTEFDLTDQTIEKTWWDKLWGNTGKVTTNTFNGIKGIEEVTNIYGADVDVAKRYYINASDYDEFKSVYKTGVQKNGDAMYLLRYNVSDYISQEATLLMSASAVLGGVKQVDTNAYFAQEDVHLDFEIIDITMYNGEYHVIPVAMKPIDVIPAATPPVYTTSDDWWKNNSWWMWIVIALLAIVLIIALLPVLPTIITVLAKVLLFVVKAVVWIIALPFKGIAALIRAIKERREDKG